MKNTDKTSSKKRELSEIEAAECAALNEIYHRKKKQLGLSQEKIATEGLKANGQSAASHYLMGRNALNIESAAVFARYLEVPVSAFSKRLAQQIKEISRSNASNLGEVIQPVEAFRYPVISWVAAGAMDETADPLPADDSGTYQASEYDSTGPAFWLKVTGDSMASPSGMSINEGTLILVDTAIEAAPGRLVVAKLPDSNEATFRMLVSDGGKLYLKPLNLGYPIESFGESSRIIGVVVQAMQRFY